MKTEVYGRSIVNILFFICFEIINRKYLFQMFRFKWQWNKESEEDNVLTRVGWRIKEMFKDDVNLQLNGKFLRDGISHFLNNEKVRDFSE